MFAVIFTAELNEIDNDYYAIANRMRELVINEYGCVDLTSVAEAGKEITVSYWHQKEQIDHWKQNKEHIEAQQKGKDKWYRNYRVEVVEILHAYENA